MVSASFRLRAIVGALALVLAVERPAQAQAVRVDASGILPYPAKQGGDRAPGAPNVVLFGTAFLGAVGEVDGVPADVRRDFHYASVHLLFSAAALPTGRQTDRSIVGDLQRLNARVTLTPLDSAQRPIENGAALQLLATVPDSMIVASRRPPGDSGSVHAETAALSVVTRMLLPELQAGVGILKRVGPALASFTNLYHRPTARLQIGYISDLSAFGWLWHAQETEVIEGTHRTSAVIEINGAVHYVRVQIHLIGEWQSRGAWQRDFDVVLRVSAAP